METAAETERPITLVCESDGTRMMYPLSLIEECTTLPIPGEDDYDAASSVLPMYMTPVEFAALRFCLDNVYETEPAKFDRFLAETRRMRMEIIRCEKAHFQARQNFQELMVIQAVTQGTRDMRVLNMLADFQELSDIANSVRGSTSAQKFYSMLHQQYQVSKVLSRDQSNPGITREREQNLLAGDLLGVTTQKDFEILSRQWRFGTYHENPAVYEKAVNVQASKARIDLVEFLVNHYGLPISAISPRAGYVELARKGLIAEIEKLENLMKESIDNETLSEMLVASLQSLDRCKKTRQKDDDKHLNMVNWLLRRGAAPTPECIQKAPQDMELLRSLIAAGANITHAPKHFQASVEGLDRDTAEFFLSTVSSNEDRTMLVTHANNKCLRALISPHHHKYGLSHKAFEVVKFLHEHGAPQNFADTLFAGLLKQKKFGGLGEWKEVVYQQVGHGCQACLRERVRATVLAVDADGRVARVSSSSSGGDVDLSGQISAGSSDYSDSGQE